MRTDRLLRCVPRPPIRRRPSRLWCFILVLLPPGLLLPAPTLAAEGILRLATTTSTHDSGLLGSLIPAFETASGLEVTVHAVGSGVALRMGRLGQVDVLLVHAPVSEQAFMVDGYGKDRQSVMSNQFLIVGPGADPAGINDQSGPGAQLQSIAASESLFVSRGDDSGTHKKEKRLWRGAGIDPIGQDWYLETGLGMSATARVASERQGYLLIDNGTWLALHDELSLKVLSRPSVALATSYSIITVDPNKHPEVNHAGAQSLLRWFAGPEGQRLIGEFRKQGQPLFDPVTPLDGGSRP